MSDDPASESELDHLPDQSDGGPFAIEGETECLIEIDLRGADGAYGVDGESHPYPAKRHGIDGEDGGDASPGMPGSDATSAMITLGRLGDSAAGGVVRVVTQLQSSAAANRAYRNESAIGDEGYIFILAKGGRGGNGGRGGDGGPGSSGYPGADATRFSRGSDGGPGGHGGNAGNPSDGEAGGRGGDIDLVVDYDEQGLLMLVKGNFEGGEIGYAGEPGRGGAGGAGGPGGSSYHWTESESYTDSQGRRQTRITSHSNPGGSRGRDGYDGQASSYKARDGQRGEDGRLRIVVKQPGGRELVYSSPYDLELVTFDVDGEYKIIEPDSLASVNRICVRNIGGMPTPPNCDICIRLEADDWMETNSETLLLDRRLDVGESLVFDQTGLPFRMADVVVDEPRRQAFRLQQPILPIARLESGIGRPFRNFESLDSIEVRFPVELTEIIALNSLAPGESTRVRWGITNVSDETFDDRFAYRSVRTGTRILGGKVDAGQVVYFDETGDAHDLLTEVHQVPILALAPGETRWIESRIGIRNHSEVVGYQDLVFGVELLLQRPSSSSRRQEYRCVDFRQEKIRVAEQYRRTEGARFLLIANQKTDDEQIEKWTQLADYFGSGLDIWDISYYGFLDFLRQFDRSVYASGPESEKLKGETQTLLTQWRGMTVIIPNNYFETAAGKTTAFELFAKSQFVRVAADHDINFYIVGDSRTGGEAMLQASLIPVNPHETLAQQKSQADFLRHVKRWSKYVARSSEVVGGTTKTVAALADASLGPNHTLPVEKRTFLFQPNRQWLEQEARDLQRTLSKVDPLHRWVIVHRYDTEGTDTSWGFFKRRKVGRLEARRTLDATKGSAVLYEVDAIDMIDKDFINSQQNKHGIFLALKFEDKVDRFIRLVSERVFPRLSENYVDRPLTDDEISKIGRELIDSILVDIYNEQYVARNCRTWGASGVRPLLPKLNYLAERSLNYGLTYRQMQDNAVTLPLLYDLLANIRYMAKRSRTVWDLGIFPTAYLKRSRAVTSHMLERVDRIVINIFGRKLHWWDKWSGPSDDYDPFGNAKNAIPKGLARDTADEALRVVEAELERRKIPLSRYTLAQSHPGLTYDPELLAERDRVMSGRDYDVLVQKELVAEQKRAEMEYAVAKQRSELLVPLATETTVTTTPVAQPLQQPM